MNHLSRMRFFSSLRFAQNDSKVMFLIAGDFGDGGSSASSIPKISKHNVSVCHSEHSEESLDLINSTII